MTDADPAWFIPRGRGRQGRRASPLGDPIAPGDGQCGEGAKRREAVLPSWNEGASRESIATFVEAAERLPTEDRVAVFDNDGTLWCEKPITVELGFVLHRLAEMAAADPSLRDRQPWRGVSRPALRLLIDHDDPDREFEYLAGAEEALRVAPAEGWTVVSVREDWARVFAD